jgi:mannan endo-1,4-beta-mannosidase
MRVRVAACAAVVLAAAASCAQNPRQIPATAGSGSRVLVTQGQLRLDGHPWWPRGFDAYQLGTDWAVNDGCGAQVDLDDYFASLPPHSVTRFNAFASLAVNKDTGALDYRRLDAVFSAAERRGQLLVAVLSSGEGACEDGVFKDHDWYAGGWRATTSAARFLPYGRWLDAAVQRWGPSPALAGWELVGEPEPSVCGDAGCLWQQRSCPPDAAATLRAFFDAAGQRLRAFDADTPIWEGVAGGGQCGTRGDEYGQVARSPFIDVLDLHDYGPSGVALPGDAVDGVARRLAQAREVNKPLVVAEMGQPAGSCQPLHVRAADLARKVQVQRTAGTAGVMFWAFVPDPRLNNCTMDIGPGDPLFGVLDSLSP